MLMLFDLKWFVSVPGMLMTCGVLILLVGLILWIVSSVKSKKEKNPLQENATAAPSTTSEASNPTNAVPEVAQATPTVEAAPAPVAIESPAPVV